MRRLVTTSRPEETTISTDNTTYAVCMTFVYLSLDLLAHLFLIQTTKLSQKAVCILSAWHIFEKLSPFLKSPFITGESV